jgi:3-methyladenine DNA glycosylase/8-oxoguanine DNA glycosylase
VKTRSITIDAPLDLRATLRPVSGVWGRYAADGWYRPMRTPEGPATLHVRRDDSGVHGRAWGPGAEWVIDRLDRWIGLGDRPEEFVPEHPLLAQLHRRSLGRRFGASGLVFEALLVAICSQKVTGKEAAMAMRSMSRLMSDPAPGPLPLLLPPDPDRIAGARYHDFHRMRLERKRADTLIGAARDVARIDRLADVGPGDARRYLERMRGVGEWSSAETVAVSHGDADAVSVGDFHLKHYVSWHLAGEPRGTDDRMLELLEPFRPHRGRVIRLLESAGRYPRYGPRVTIRDYRDH